MRISRSTFFGLALVLLMTFTMGMQCTKEQKQAVIDASLPHLCQLLKDKGGPLGDAGAAVCAYDQNRSEAFYERASAAFSAVLVRHDVSPTVLEMARTGFDILKFFAPATFAEVDPNSADARAAKKELDEKFRHLEKLARSH